MVIGIARCCPKLSGWHSFPVTMWCTEMSRLQTSLFRAVLSVRNEHMNVLNQPLHQFFKKEVREERHVSACTILKFEAIE